MNPVIMRHNDAKGHAYFGRRQAIAKAGLRCRTFTDGIGGADRREHRLRARRHGSLVPLWVMLHELNADILETSYVIEDRSPRGAFSPAFTDSILRGVQQVRATGRLGISRRT